ncbi:oligoribonuclease [Chelonus insularis]|uniref:oligoribonuclease n=1 Tax=Chelonus insularis TaxID=460826 RepID=UPI00158B3605|nr:oligoribonuclease [Chelonus insularis]
MNLTKTSLSLIRKFLLTNHNLYNSAGPHVIPFLNKKRKFSQFKMENKNNIVWIDMEMTGLDIEKDRILEISALVTNQDLEIISPTFHTIIHQPDNIMANMNEWCLKNHAETGLIDDVKKSNVNIKEAESKLLDFLKPFTEEKANPLAGNTIWMDRIFLRKYMYNVDIYLNYRIIDVSSIKELCKRWAPHIAENVPKKRNKHRAVEDIEDSIKELQYYRENLFQLPL